MQSTAAFWIVESQTNYLGFRVKTGVGSCIHQPEPLQSNLPGFILISPAAMATPGKILPVLVVFLLLKPELKRIFEKVKRQDRGPFVPSGAPFWHEAPLTAATSYHVIGASSSSTLSSSEAGGGQERGS